MRRLLLLRHAKAERSQPGGRDEDRVLAPRGRADTKKLGAYMAGHALIPDHAVVSPSARTRETWELLGAAFSHPPPASFEDGLYNASPLSVLQAIRETAPKTVSLVVIGHNPGLHELALMLVASGDIDSRERLGEGFPTSALAAISFAADDWSNVHTHGGRLEHFITPDWLAQGTD